MRTVLFRDRFEDLVFVLGRQIRFLIVQWLDFNKDKSLLLHLNRENIHF